MKARPWPRLSAAASSRFTVGRARHNMPYGVPWDYPFTVLHYICCNCSRYIGEKLTPYCPRCGAKQPDESEMKSLGLVVVRDGEKRVRRVKELGEVNAFLDAHKGCAAGLWRYYVSHSELEIRLCHSGGPNLTEWRNTAIYCASTSVIRFDRLRWDSNLAVTTVPNEFGRDDFILKDSDAGVFVQCEVLNFYVDLDPEL